MYDSFHVEVIYTDGHYTLTWLYNNYDVIGHFKKPYTLLLKIKYLVQ